MVKVGEFDFIVVGAGSAGCVLGGSPPCDVDALADAIVHFSELVADTEGLFDAIDINPLSVGPGGSGVVIADALIIPLRYS